MQAFMHMARWAVAMSCGAALTLLPAGPAMACLSCGCGGSGSSADMGAITGTAGIFSQGRKMLLQQGVSLRQVTGSFNELGTWSPTPVGGSLQTLQGTLGITWFPTPDVGVGLQLPGAANALNKASWGPYGSILPTDTGPAYGGFFGDVSLQASYKLLELEFSEFSGLALAGWGGLTLPTGLATGDPASLTGNGLWAGQLGLTALGQWDNWEGIVSLGGQLPLGATGPAAPYAVGPGLTYQLQGHYRLGDAWRVGLTLNGFVGQTVSLGGPPPWATKLKVMPSVAWQWNASQGARAALGIDPALIGRNSMTDATLFLIFYQYL
jgi:hypothetical protein